MHDREKMPEVVDRAAWQAEIDATTTLIGPTARWSRVNDGGA